MPIRTIRRKGFKTPDGKTGQNKIIKIANDTTGAARNVSCWGFLDRMDRIPNEHEFASELRNNRLIEHTFAIWDDSDDHKKILPEREELSDEILAWTNEEQIEEICQGTRMFETGQNEDPFSKNKTLAK